MAYAYANQPKNRMTAIAAVAGIHAGLGALLVYGLATGSFAPPEMPKLVGGQLPVEPPPPPEPTPEPPPTTTRDAASRPVVAPLPPISIPTAGPQIDTTPIILPPTKPRPQVSPHAVPTVAPLPPPPSPTPSFDPVPARPSNNTGTWVTQADYKSSWIARNYAGEVGFRLSVGAGGRVESCSVTRSSGIAALDQATCQLVERRARFTPAKNDAGRAVPGQYSSAVRWQLPD